MPSPQSLLLAGASLVLLAACGNSSSNTTTSGSGAGGATSSTGTTSSGHGGSPSTGAGIGGDFGLDGGPGDGSGGATCDPPFALIALDRTQTMHKTPSGAEPTDGPDYQSSKFYQAITAIQTLTAAPADGTIRFGLELWPKNEPGCVTLAQKVGGTSATNPSCEDGEVLVPPALTTGATIASTIDPGTTTLCNTTPTGQGLLTASTWLQANAVAGRGEYIILVTDGADWDQSCPTPDPVAVTQQLAMAGIKTFVVGFSAEGDIMPGGVGAGFLNDMACAGETAVGFPTSCKTTASGYVSVDPMGATLYLSAGDAAALGTALHSVAAQLCCDCVN